MARTEWRELHQAHRLFPRSLEERRITVLLDGIKGAIDAHLALGKSFPDANTSEAIGLCLDGAVMLLNENLGALDAGTLWDEIEDYANIVGWSLDDSEVVYG